MKRKRVFLTGATGSMGKATLNALTKDAAFEIIALVRDTEVDRKIIKPYLKCDNLTIHYGDLTVYQDVLDCMSGVDIVLYCAALVSPLADAHPKLAMAVNYGGTLNLIQVIKEQPTTYTSKIWAFSCQSAKSSINCLVGRFSWEASYADVIKSCCLHRVARNIGSTTIYKTLSNHFHIGENLDRYT